VVGRKVGSKKALAMLEHMVATQRNLVEELRYSTVIRDPSQLVIILLCIILILL
jgi:hypothetical protein